MFLSNKKCRIYAAYGVLQTPKFLLMIRGGGENGKENIRFSWDGYYAYRDSLGESLEFCLNKPDEPETVQFGWGWKEIV